MNTDLKARAEALLAALGVDGFRYIAGRPLDDLPWLKGALAAFMEAADAATVLNLIRERDEALERERQTFKDASEINAHSEASLTAMAAEREEVERLLSAMDREEAYLHRMIDASAENGGIMHGDLEGAFHRIRDKDSDDAERAEAITKEPPHAG